jgi:hypothetical protein
MKMERLVRLSGWFLVFMVLVHPLQAQKFNLRGVVTDEETGEGVEFATVSVLKQSDSSFVTGGLTETGGNFKLRLETGVYQVQLQFVGYKPTSIKNVRISQDEITNIGKVNLSPDLKQLEEVVVQGERTQMELTLDKKVYNVGKDLSNLGGTASDILDNLPSVTVDVEGNVELRGSSNVQVLIDGKMYVIDIFFAQCW